MSERMQKRGIAWQITGMCYVALLTVSVVSQTASSGRFMTFKDLLRERKVDLTEDALVSALHNPDSQIRFLAALVLAEDKAKDAIPAITEALDKENNPETHVNMALALAQLGSDKGNVSLTEACTDPHLAPMFRVYAAKYLLDLGKESCPSTLESLLRSGTDPGVRVLALSQQARFQDAGAADSQAVLESVLGALSDKESLVRVAACHALVSLKSVSAIPHLKQAVAAEQDEGRSPSTKREQSVEETCCASSVIAQCGKTVAACALNTVSTKFLHGPRLLVFAGEVFGQCHG